MASLSAFFIRIERWLKERQMGDMAGIPAHMWQ
jgi:hypothetical protein